MEQEKEFYYQLAKTIQTWLEVETATYSIYAAIMNGANPHLVSATFHKIESFKTRLGLIDSCFALIFARDSESWKEWRSLKKKSVKLSEKRNKIVHQPVKLCNSGSLETIEISPSYFNAQALVKGQTSYNGPVLSSSFKPALAETNECHKIDILNLLEYEREFKKHAGDLRSYLEEIGSELKSALESTK